ncbi:uncharacterized protein BDCG_09053 [Blastomyces dermatitidis ER-3]|uniref:Uncharacterized protein n=3 Tax=Blastomyces TaxID=229219 RepID=A0A179U7N5_BLAGS|nr:uncharacterized protein BDBG_00432 [Blastomyces gilchristii SLH14081]XP_045273458.1 uncharacterized protein BDCG_09053 [Blastomyces dermatitidis ER-3]EGE84278.1 hypothetical protein BDDG_07223 [Blastomyces dermatitidis ATCC 18188]EQL34083.1 hypothetical protein BDFG_04000 [Blastomyces dermatitidis ATCC 26199]EEQ85784.1 hypothetical protein BDCG_09053 [Blastomyces dermatitidis ER-3]OAT03743.1 hypothetical protein BDBG_00432 [Blastomyces gilchristii SLH14081]
MNILTFFSTLLLLLATQLVAAQDDMVTSTRTTTITNTVTVTIIRSVGTSTTADSTITPTPTPAATTSDVSDSSTPNFAVAAPTALPMLMAGGLAVVLGVAL